MRWLGVGDEPGAEQIRVRFLQSPLNRLGHYIDTGKSGARYKPFKKISLTQYSVDGSFQVEFSLYWKKPSAEQREANEEYRSCLIIIRHNLLAPDVFARLSAVHSDLVRRYVINNRREIWGAPALEEID
ncbi:hypothetical protein M422DRAFT_239148 [Sphaerobolus stellatus SS14]|nr:hypothetical protein M422DRAFT_239148 [Sphaerobolus stellatus SS14]